jgi:hypothetical protein
LINGMIMFGDNNKQGIISITGKIIIKLEYDLCNNYSDGIAVAKDYSGANYTSFAFDTKGKLIFKCSGNLGNFHDGMATLEDNSSNLYGYVNSSGKIIIKPIYHSANDFYDDKAEVEVSGSNYNNQFYYIDKTGKKLDKINNNLDNQIQKFDDGYYIKNDDGFRSLYDKNNNVVIKDVYSIKRINERLYAVIEENAASPSLSELDIPKAIFDKKGNKLTDYFYYDVNELKKGIIEVSTDKETYLIDENLKQIKGFKRLEGSWSLSLSGSLIKAILYNNIRYYTSTGKLVFQSDGTYSLSDGSKLTCEVYTPNRKVDIIYPKISNLSNNNVEKSINQSMYNYFINDKVKDIVDNSSENIYRINFTFKRISNILNIQADGANIHSINGGFELIKSDYYFNLKTGTEYTLIDLFNKKTDYKPFLENEIHDKLKANSFYNPIYNLGLNDVSGFKIFDNNIQIYFSYNGQLFNCDLLFSQLDKYIDKSGDLWKCIDEWKNMN